MHKYKTANNELLPCDAEKVEVGGGGGGKSRTDELRTSRFGVSAELESSLIHLVHVIFQVFHCHTDVVKHSLKKEHMILKNHP